MSGVYADKAGWDFCATGRPAGVRRQAGGGCRAPGRRAAQWRQLAGLHGVTSTAALTVGSGDITTNAASVLLSGSKASFAQLSRLRTNEGALTIDGGLAFTLDSLANTGTVTRVGRRQPDRG